VFKNCSILRTFATPRGGICSIKEKTKDKYGAVENKRKETKWRRRTKKKRNKDGTAENNRKKTKWRSRKQKK
jgi:hypothetical protein